MSSKITSESVFEDSIVAHLCDEGGYEVGLLEHWSRELALDTETLLQFVQDTQAEAWGRLKAIHGHMVEEKFLATTEGCLTCCDMASLIMASASKSLISGPLTHSIPRRWRCIAPTV